MNKRKILVVDDEPIARDNLAHVVAKDGHLVRVAASGQEAVDLLRDEEMDLVLTDLCMQGKDGMAVLPGVVSRKKQIVPPLMATFQKIQEEQD